MSLWYIRQVCWPSTPNTLRLPFPSKRSHVLTSFKRPDWVFKPCLFLSFFYLTCCHFPHDCPAPAILTSRVFLQFVQLSLQPFVFSVPSVWSTGPMPQLLPSSSDQVLDLRDTCPNHMIKNCEPCWPPISYLPPLYFCIVVVIICSTRCVCICEWMSVVCMWVWSMYFKCISPFCSIIIVQTNSWLSSLYTWSSIKSW